MVATDDFWGQVAATESKVKDLRVQWKRRIVDGDRDVAVEEFDLSRCGSAMRGAVESRTDDVSWSYVDFCDSEGTARFDQVANEDGSRSWYGNAQALRKGLPRKSFDRPLPRSAPNELPLFLLLAPIEDWFPAHRSTAEHQEDDTWIVQKREGSRRLSLSVNGQFFRPTEVRLLNASGQLRRRIRTSEWMKFDSTWISLLVEVETLDPNNCPFPVSERFELRDLALNADVDREEALRLPEALISDSRFSGHVISYFSYFSRGRLLSLDELSQRQSSY